VAEVIARNGESIDSLLRRFKTAVNKAEIFAEMKRRASYVKPGERRRIKHRRAVKRILKAKERFAELSNRARGPQGGDARPAPAFRRAA